MRVIWHYRSLQEQLLDTILGSAECLLIVKFGLVLQDLILHQEQQGWELGQQLLCLLQQEKASVMALAMCRL